MITLNVNQCFRFDRFLIGQYELRIALLPHWKVGKNRQCKSYYGFTVEVVSDTPELTQRHVPS